MNELKVGDYTRLWNGEQVRIDKVLGFGIYAVITGRDHMVRGKPTNTFNAKIVQKLVLMGEEQIMSKDYDKLDDDELLPCGNCGHDEVVHYRETGRNCSDGGGHGNTCPCPKYRPGGKRKMTHKLTDREKHRAILFRIIDGRALAGLNRDLKKAKLERDLRENTKEKGEQQ